MGVVGHGQTGNVTFTIGEARFNRKAAILLLRDLQSGPDRTFPLIAMAEIDASLLCLFEREDYSECTRP